MASIAKSQKLVLAVILATVAAVAGLIASGAFSSPAQADLEGDDNRAMLPIVQTESGVAVVGECFITTQKALEGPVLDPGGLGDKPALRELEIIKVISACPEKFFDPDTGETHIGVPVHIETIVIKCKKDLMLTEGGCVQIFPPPDSDGDGLSDEEEAKMGTDPHNPDTDRDGVLDGKDPAPLDPTVP